ncbi:GTPase [Halobacillus massiliensis]|uniref:GTPase n=1 Tax=Halobacillus massiliensis TaxID=1926286 RepID=UPI0009E4BFCD|nr:GTPase [Halobacillus massiliensis]
MTKENIESYSQMNDLLDFILKELEKSKIPKGTKAKIKAEIMELKSFLLDARPARIAIVGRRGAGKSSLINAIFGEERAAVGDVKPETAKGKWHSYTSDSGTLEILDTRGLGEGEASSQDHSEHTPLEELQNSIKDKCPDAILFLTKAKEVSSRIDEDTQELLALKNSIKDIHEYNIPIIGVVTQVDELSPKSVDQPPFNNDVKQNNINEAITVLSTKLEEAVSTPVNVIPVCSYFEMEENQIVYDIRWNIDELLNYLIEQLPNEAQVVLAKLAKVKAVQKKLSRKIGKLVSSMTSAVGANPIPIADLPIITGLQMAMISSIAIISGRKLKKKQLMEFLGALGVNLASGFALRQAARKLVKLIPGGGSVISGGIAFAGTYALSEAAIAYFIDESPLESVKSIYNDTFKRKRKETDEE